jgi:hypothetical protein
MSSQPNSLSSLTFHNCAKAYNVVELLASSKWVIGNIQSRYFGIFITSLCYGLPMFSLQLEIEPLTFLNLIVLKNQFQKNPEQFQKRILKFFPIETGVLSKYTY